jgi:membrane fusion protein (multidrug efflux system)
LRRVLAVVSLSLGLCACRARGAGDPVAPESATAPAVVSVAVAPLARTTLTDVVSGPGHTAAISQQKVRAPFAGTLLQLTAVDGDRVGAGQVVGTIVSRDSEAALAGAREMVRDARTEAEKADAARAVALAERNLVRAAFHAAVSGVVLSHAASAGDRLSEDQEILTIADGSSIVFLVDLPQSDLSRVRPGQRVAVEIAGRPETVAGTVHDVLPSANATDFTASVRVDLVGLREIPPLGLFGTGHITVGSRPNVLVAPEAALIRDDVSGVTRLALVQNGKTHWVDVTVGARGKGGVEIVAPALPVGTPVVVSGQVGLPEGAPVAPRP